MTNGNGMWLRLTLGLFAMTTGLLLGVARDSSLVPVVAPQKDKSQEKGTSPAQIAPLPKGINSNSDICLPCHTGPDEKASRKYVESFKSNEIIRLSESVTWEEQDVHRTAFKVLEESPLARQMETRLKASGTRRADYRVTTDHSCLICHSVDQTPDASLETKRFDVSYGISCNLCHGLKSTWQDEHPKDVLDWRTKTPAEKFAAGLNDLRNPVIKAALCVSCHVGNPNQGKVLTHEMYAAGHPPLAPFELASYMEAQPRHWGYPTELKYFASIPAKDTWSRYHFHPADTESYLSRHFAVGAITVLRAEAELLLADAEAALGKKGKHDTNGMVEREGLDFARFDCYSCHHDLKYPSRRQKRDPDSGPPGRPPLRASSGITAGVLARHAQAVQSGGLAIKAAGFEEKWAALRKAVVSRPFGNPTEVRAKATEIISWCADFLELQSTCPVPLYPSDQVTRLRDMLVKSATSAEALANPEAATCLAWSTLTLSEEAKVIISEDSRRKLAETVPLNVRTAPFKSPWKNPKTMKEEMIPVPIQFATRMQKLNDFDSDRFRDAFSDAFNFKPVPPK
jgi:hypothetical protein